MSPGPGDSDSIDRCDAGSSTLGSIAAADVVLGASATTTSRDCGLNGRGICGSAVFASGSGRAEASAVSPNSGSVGIAAGAETAAAPPPAARGSHWGSTKAWQDGVAGALGTDSGRPALDASPPRPSSAGLSSLSLWACSSTSPALASDSFACRTGALNKGAQTARQQQLFTGAQHMGTA